MLSIVMIAFLVLLILGVPIGICMGLAAIVWILAGGDMSPMIIASKMYGQSMNSAFLAVPFFMLAGNIMERTGITDSIVEFADSLVGHIRGGMSHTVCVTGMIMAGISGSGQADTAAIGNLMIPTLTKNGYDEGYSCAVVASAGGIGPIIPPSIFFIIYATCTQYSVGRLFAGGAIPGVLMGIGFIIIGYFYARKHNIPKGKFKGFRHVAHVTKKAIWPLLMPLIIIGGILGGIFTTTEAGIVASVYGITYGFIRKELDLKGLWEALCQSVLSSIGPLMIVVMSTVLGYILTRLNVSQAVLALCLKMNNELAFYLLILVICVIAGMFLDGSAIILLLMPVLMPVVNGMGLDFLHFSMFFLLAAAMNQLTPPVGCLLFVAAGIKGTPLNAIIKPIIPFVIVCIIVTLLTIPFPWITCWLPTVLNL